MKKVTIIAAVLLVLLALAGCGLFGLSADPVVGKWQWTVIQKEFKSDGTMSSAAVGVTEFGTWERSGGSLTQNLTLTTTESVSFSSDKATMTIGAISYTRM
jgi:hypothetical protein